MTDQTDHTEPTTTEPDLGTVDVSDEGARRARRATPPDPDLFDGTSAQFTHPEPTRARRRRPKWLLPVAAALVIAVVAAGVTRPLWWPAADPGDGGEAVNSDGEVVQTIDENGHAVPLRAGATIVLPDNVDPGLPNTSPEVLAHVGHGPDQTPAAAEAGIGYVDPDRVDEYRTVGLNGVVTHTVPVDGECPVSEAGGIGSPDNYRHGCWHMINGAVFYTTHAVRGARVGGFENVGLLREGQEVILDGVEYRVSSVESFPIDRLPEYLFQPGQVHLLTCQIDSAVNQGAPFSKNDIATLTLAG